MKNQLLFITIASCIALVCITSVEADYSYAEDTPGTSWNNVALGATGNPIPATRKFGPVGNTFAGEAAVQLGQNPVLNTNRFDCGAIITDISAQLSNIQQPVQPQPPKQVSDQASPAAKLMYQHLLAQYQLALAAYPAALARYQAAQQMRSGAVIGVAVVDYGTAAAPNIRAFLSRSGTTAFSPFEAQALTYAASRQPGGPLQAAARWQFIDKATDDVNYVKGFRSTRLVNLPHLNGNTEVQDIAAWTADVNAAAPINSEGILFAVGPTEVAKKWPTGGHNAWHSDRVTHRTTCAMQKMLYTLFGMAPGAVIPGGFPRLQANAHNQADNVNGLARLVCAAEAAHDPNGIPVKKWNNQVRNYAQSTLVPSCSMCQSIVPEIIDGSLRPVDCAAINVNVNLGAVANGVRGACGNGVAHGATCQVTCNNGYFPLTPASTCSFGVLTLQQCGPPCDVANVNVPTLNGQAVVNALAVANAGMTPDHPVASNAALPVCRHQLKRGHSCKVACNGATSTPQPNAATPVVCDANGQLQFPIGVPTCEGDCPTPPHNSENRVLSVNRVTNPNTLPCGGSLKFGLSCTPTCQHPRVPLTNSRCGANGQLATQATCAVPPVVVLAETDSAEMQSESASESIQRSTSRIASAKLKNHRRSHATQVLQP